MFNKSTLLLAVVASLGVVTAQENASANSTSSTGAIATETSSSSVAAASSSVVPISTSMIPTNISTGCSSFLASLNTDSQFTTCMTPLANITSLYNPVGNSSAEASQASTVTSTLTQLCASSSGCSDSLIQTYLSSFYSACTAELTNPTSYSEDVREIYDFLYVVNPFKGAVCSRDGSSQKYCVLEIASSAAANSTTTPAAAAATAQNSTSNSTGLMSSFKSFVTTQDLFSPQVALAAANLVIISTANTANSLTRRFLSLLPRDGTTGISSNTIVTPNTTTYLSTGIAYLFLQPNMSSSLLCTSCSKSILASYVAWEAQVPYALGLASSPILGKQSALWASVSATCGTTFINSITSQAGILSANATTSSSTGVSGGMVTTSVGALGVIATILGVAGAALL